MSGRNFCPLRNDIVTRLGINFSQKLQSCKLISDKKLGDNTGTEHNNTEECLKFNHRLYETSF